jgi:hypothetical protein
MARLEGPRPRRRVPSSSNLNASSGCNVRQATRFNSSADSLYSTWSQPVYFILGSQRCWARSNSSTMLRICGKVHTAAVRGSSMAA